MTARPGATLRLLAPQWQGAGTPCVRDLAAEFPFDVARRGYAVGSAVLGAVLPAHDDPTATAPVDSGDAGLEERDGVEAKAVLGRCPRDDAARPRLARRHRLQADPPPAWYAPYGLRRVAETAS